MPQNSTGKGSPSQPIAPALVHAAALGLLVWGAHNAGMIRPTDTTAHQQGVNHAK